MSPLPWSLRLLELCATASAAALELLVQSTLVIAVGLTAAWLLRGRGSALRSAIYRATLVAVVACPAATWLISALGLSAAIDWLPSLRPTVVKLVQPASDPSNIGRSDVAVQNEAKSGATAQLSGAAARQADLFPSSRVGEPFGNSPRFSDVPLDEAPGVRRESSGDRRAQSIRKDGIAAVKAVPAQPAGPAWVVNPAAAVLAIGVAAFWLLGSSVLFLRLLIDHFRVIAICRTASPADADDRLLRDELAAKLGISAPRLLRSPYLSGPCLTGLWRHTILLPEESSDVPLSSVLIHELAHFRRGDSRWNMLRHAVRAVLFFQPLSWRLSRRMEEAAEEVCDDHVVHWGADRSVYANGLVRLAEQRSLPLSTVVPLVRFRSLLGRRVQRILDRSHRLSLRAGMKALCAIAAAGLAVTLVVALLAPSGRSASAPPPSDPKKSDAGADKKAADAAKAAETPNDAKRLSGTVLLPSGKPAAGAHVVLIGQLRQATRPADFTSAEPIIIDRTECDDAGHFQLTPANLSSSHYLWTRLLVRSAKTGLAWRAVNLENADSSFPISLPEAVPARGRLITLEGKAAAGIRVTVQGITHSGLTDSSSDNGVDAVDSPPLADVWPTGIVTDADGWFTVPGVAADAELGLYLDQEPFAPEQWLLDIRKFDPSQRVHVLTPAQIIKGVVVTADTGKPLASASIDASQGLDIGMNGMRFVLGKTDAEGRFRVNPFAAKSYTVTAFGPKGSAYLAKQIEFKWSDTEREHDVRVELPRGVLVHGTIVEKTSGKPVAKATVRYTAHRNNPHAKGVPLDGVDQPTELTDEQGRFSIAVPAGAGHLTVKSATGEYVVKELDERQVWEGRPGGERLYVNADAALDLPAHAREFAVDFKIRRGVTVHGEMIRSDGGRPERLVMMHRGMTLFSDEFDLDSPTMIAGNRFEVRCVPPDGEYQVFFLDPDAKQCKLFVAHGSDAGKPLRVEMEPCGSLTMRFLDPDGKPVAGHSPDLMIVFTPGQPKYGSSNKTDMPRADETFAQNFDRVNCWAIATDENGRLTIPTLIPGLMYRLLEISDKGQEDKPWKFREITVKPGERLTLPDIVIRNPDVLQRAEVNWTKKQKEQATKAATPSIANSGESPTQMPTGTTSAVQALTVERAMSNAAAQIPQSAASATDQKPFAAISDNAPRQVRGQVVGPDGKALAGAKLFLLDRNSAKTPERGVKPSAETNAEGRFDFSVKKSDFDPAAGDDWIYSRIVATADGFGFTFGLMADFDASGNIRRVAPPRVIGYLGKLSAGNQLALRLAPDDAPLTGRIVSLEGKPIAGARVAFKEMWTNKQGSLDAWEKAAKEPKADSYSISRQLGVWENAPQLSLIVPTATTDRDGRFTMRGIGRERIARLMISGAGIETKLIRARTRNGDKVVVPKQSRNRADMPPDEIYANNFTHVAAPSNAVVGRVTDRVTGKPLAGATIMSQKLHGDPVHGLSQDFIRTVSGADGQYRLEGMPLGDDNEIGAFTMNQPYLPMNRRARIDVGSEPIKLDFQLPHGIWVEGRVTDKITGKPLSGTVEYFVFNSNPNYEKLGRTDGIDVDLREYHRAGADGRFRIPAFPGRGIIGVLADDNSTYSSRGVGAEKIEGGDTKSVRFSFSTSDTKSRALMFPTAPYFCAAFNFNALAEIDPPERADVVKLDLTLSSGATVTGKLIDADGKPVIGALYCGESPAWENFRSTEQDSFQVNSYEPNKLRRLVFYEPERNLAGRFMLKGDPPIALVVRLEPAGSVRGRLVDEHGSPLAGAVLFSGLVWLDPEHPDPMQRLPIPPSDSSNLSKQSPTTDDQGNFEVHGLIPGQEYRLGARDGNQPGFHGVFPDLISVRAGETKDLGDFTPRLFNPAEVVEAMDAEAAAKSRPADAKAAPQDSAKPNADRTSKPPTAGRTDSTQSNRKADDDLLSVNGRVLDPQGKPVARVEVLAVQQYWKTWRHVVPLVSTKSDDAGRFHLEFKKSQIVHQEASLRFVSIIAKPTESKLGIGWLGCDAIKVGEEVALQLVADEPLEGRIVDLEGKPAAGVEVKAIWIATNAKSDLTTWLEALKSGIPSFGSQGFDPPDRGLPLEFADQWTTKSDADGRFRITGLGHDRHATIIISGNSRTAVAKLIAITRPIEPINVDLTNAGGPRRSDIFYGSRFQYAVEPSQPIEGVVRDAKTGHPLKGIQVVSEMFAGTRNIAVFGEYPYPVRSVSDENGIYRLDGMPRGEGNRILAMPADGQPYFMRSFDVPTARGFEPVKFDLGLRRGVLIEGRVSDKVTGEPIVGAQMVFTPWPDNPNIKEMQEFRGGGMHSPEDARETNLAGRFNLVGVPGRGLVEVMRLPRPFVYGQGQREIADLPSRSEFMNVAGLNAPFAGYPAAIKETRIGDQDERIRADLELDPGKRLTLDLVDPDGKPLKGVVADGLWPKPQSVRQSDAGPAVEVLALRPDERRLVLLHQKEQNLGKAIRICWNDAGPGPVTVKLEPCGTLKARLFDKNGDPVRGGSLRFDADPGDFELSLPEGATDRDGRLNYKLLLPGGKYNVSCDCRQTGFQTVLKDLTVLPGEIVDLGEFDITSKDRPKPKRTNAVSSKIEPKTSVPADAKGEIKSPAAAGRNDSTQSDRKADDDVFSVNGRVLDPAGKPAAGAKVVAVQDYFTTWSHTSAPLVTTESDNAGRFHLEFRKSDIVQSDQQLQRVSIVAKPLDSKLGIAWVRCDAIKPGEETTLQLVEDEPVEGQIVDLEGRPIAGVDVKVNQLSTNAKGDLTAWLSAQKGDTPSLGSQDVDVPDRGLPTEFADEWKTKTDADGRFRLTGLGHDRMADILVSGHGTTGALRVVTRPMEPITVDAAHRSIVAILNVYYGSHFQYAVEPSQPIVGIVRDAKTGRPLAGVQVVSDRLAGRFSGILSYNTRDSVSDAQGNYRLEGLPKGEGNEIVAMPPDGEPYFMRRFDVPTAPGFEPIKLDLELHRGVLIQGRVSDKATGAPVAAARMFFVPWPDNPNVDDVADLSHGQWREDVARRYQTDRDGRYTLVGVPGRGLVEVAHVLLPRIYPPGQGLREIADLPSPRDFFRVAGSQDPPDPKRTVAAKELHIGQQDVQVQADFKLESGKQLSLNVVDPEGKPLTDVKVSGDLPREYAWRQFAAGPRIDVMALWPEEERRMVLYQKERNLGKLFRVCWNKDGPGPVVVRLEPCATLKARLLDKYGDPMQGASLAFSEVNRMDSTLALPRGATDRDGRLTYTALVPGARYIVYCRVGQNSLQSIATDLSVSPGEIIDLGEFDVTSKDRPKPKRTNTIDAKVPTNATGRSEGTYEMKLPTAVREMRKQP